MSFKSLASMAAVVLLTASTAHAQSAYQPVNWSGFYLGGHLGGAWADTGFDMFQPGCCHEPLSFDADSLAGGAQIGWQHQWSNSNWITGVELSYTAAELDETRISRIIADRSRTMEVSDIFHASLRLGYALQRSLVYVKGGYANADIHITSHIASTGRLTSSSNGHEDGWNVGGGFEYSLDSI
jgi:outer membrane immunogenic protein